MTKIKVNLKNISSLYLHFPFCRHLCNYCDFYKFKLEDEDQVSAFEARLLQQIEENEQLLKTHNCKLTCLETLYIGGGTPSLWSHSGARFIQKHIIDRFGLSDECEFTIEIDPGTWTEDEIENWQKIGVNRFSIGIQSFDEKFKNYLDRAHTMKEARVLLDFLNSRKLNFSIDLMLGLPFSDKENRDIGQEIEKLVPYEPSHFSVYILKARANYLLKKNLPSEDYIAEEYQRVCENLNRRGFEQYEVSNFAKEGKRSKHNLRYWESESVASLGSNASGLLNLGKVGIRYQWKSIGLGASIEEINEESFLLEKIYMSLRSCLGLDFNLFDDENKKKLKTLCEKWTKTGYVKLLDEQRVTLNSKGYIVLDSLMDDIFRELSL